MTAPMSTRAPSSNSPCPGRDSARLPEQPLFRRRLVMSGASMSIAMSAPVGQISPRSCPVGRPLICSLTTCRSASATSASWMVTPDEFLRSHRDYGCLARTWLGADANGSSTRGRRLLAVPDREKHSTSCPIRSDLTGSTAVNPRRCLCPDMCCSAV